MIIANIWYYLSDQVYTRSCVFKSECVEPQPEYDDPKIFANIFELNRKHISYM